MYNKRTNYFKRLGNLKAYLKKYLITHNQQVDPIVEIIFTHKCQEN